MEQIGWQDGRCVYVGCGWKIVEKLEGPKSKSLDRRGAAAARVVAPLGRRGRIDEALSARGRRSEGCAREQLMSLSLSLDHL